MKVGDGKISNVCTIAAKPVSPGTLRSLWPLNWVPAPDHGKAKWSLDCKKQSASRLLLSLFLLPPPPQYHHHCLPSKISRLETVSGSSFQVSRSLWTIAIFTSGSHQQVTNLISIISTPSRLPHILLPTCMAMCSPFYLPLPPIHQIFTHQPHEHCQTQLPNHRPSHHIPSFSHIKPILNHKIASPIPHPISFKASFTSCSPRPSTTRWNRNGRFSAKNSAERMPASALRPKAGKPTEATWRYVQMCCT